MKQSLRFVTGAIALVVSFGFSLPTNAAIVTATYSGTISSGTDDVGVFGAAGASLAGLAYTSVQAFDTSLGTTGDFYSPGMEAHQLSNASTGATLTINGQSFNFSGGYFSLIDVRSDNGSNGIDFVTYDTSGLSRIDSYVGGTTMSSPPPLSVAAAYSWVPSIGGSGLGSAYAYVSVGTGFARQFNANFAGSSLEVTVSAVPEPESFAMLLAGLGIVGASVRRRQRLQA